MLESDNDSLASSSSSLRLRFICLAAALVLRFPVESWMALEQQLKKEEEDHSRRNNR